MKAIHYILICCLLGLYSCSKKCECKVTETRNYVVTGTRAESYSYGGGGTHDTYGECTNDRVYLSAIDASGNYADHDLWICE